MENMESNENKDNKENSWSMLFHVSWAVGAFLTLHSVPKTV